jgi:glyceraldehyde-3-phosphate dehydrogenase (NADP+)
LVVTGATFLTPYKREGNLIWPTLLDNVTASMRIAWEEPFGPVMPIIRVSSPDEAIEHCNKSNFGLQVRRAQYLWVDVLQKVQMCR